MDVCLYQARKKFHSRSQSRGAAVGFGRGQMGIYERPLAAGCRAAELFKLAWIKHLMEILNLVGVNC